MCGVTSSAPGKLVLAGEYAVLAGAPAIVAAMPGRVACRVTVAHKGQGQVLGRWFAARVAAPAGLAAPRAGAAVAPWALGAGAACAV